MEQYKFVDDIQFRIGLCYPRARQSFSMRAYKYKNYSFWYSLAVFRHHCRSLTLWIPLLDFRETVKGRNWAGALASVHRPSAVERRSLNKKIRSVGWVTPPPPRIKIVDSNY